MVKIQGSVQIVGLSWTKHTNVWPNCLTSHPCMIISHSSLPTSGNCTALSWTLKFKRKSGGKGVSPPTRVIQECQNVVFCFPHALHTNSSWFTGAWNYIIYCFGIKPGERKRHNFFSFLELTMCHVHSYLFSTSILCITLFYKRRNWGSEKLSNFFRVTKQVNRRDYNWTQSGLTLKEVIYSLF